MAFKKFLKILSYKKNGQAALEYFILLIVIVGLTVISLNSGFLDGIKAHLQGPDGFFQKAAGGIING